MITGLKHLHSFIPYLLLPVLIIATMVYLIKYLSKNAFTKSDKTLGLVTLILSHLQLVIGLLLYFLGSNGFDLTKIEGFMKNADLRLYAVEHIAIMVLAVALITFGYSRAKKQFVNSKKFASLGLSFLIALILILSRIPWEAWLA
jgi:signal transduction histidine kinase